MNYKREMRKLKKHRNRYFPVLARYLRLYQESGQEPVTAEITDIEEIALVLELIDIGYLDRDSFPVKKSFGTVTRLAYNGRYPLTQEGNACLDRSGCCDNGNGPGALLRLLFGKR